MATERELRRRMQQLQREIERLRTQSAQNERRLRQNMEQQIKQLETKMRNAMVRQQRETEEQYTRRIAKLREQYSAEVTQKMEALHQQAENSLQEQQKKFQELQKCNRELLNLLKETKYRQEEQNEQQRQWALSMQEQMKASRRQADGSPHDFFFQGEFSLIDAQANELKSELDNQMYQAAAADAGSAALQFDLLYVKVIQALEEWIQAFNDYAHYIRFIFRRIEQIETIPIKTKAGNFVLTPAELQFWSSDTYLAFRRKITDALEEIERIEQVGVAAYLRECETENRRAVFGKVRDAHKWNDEFTAVAMCIDAERRLSDERWYLGQLTENIVKELGYGRIKKGFRRRETGQMHFCGHTDPMDCYDMVFSVQGVDKLFITFCPVRKDGVTVHNICIVSFEPETICNDLFATAIVDNIVHELQHNEDFLPYGVQVFGIPCGADGQRLKESREAQKKKPDPQEQIRLNMKKYY